ncbi:MAG: Stk1 family PASTA domain-containing Ser/Thr kinase [Clostridiales bacterium]|nr:Stk1 family PASTA domain-containing Ser/Thr kinase [Clostridiales bacterium]
MIGKILSQRYELMEKIGEGGMANVYKAKCHVLQRFVAVKILKSQFNDDEEFIEKFDHESKSAAQLNHPNIVNIFDVGVEGKTRYIVMEYINGITLKKHIRDKNGPLDENEILRFSLQIASALEHAHKNNIIHRDIKPQNIMISENGTAKVADFGIAKAINSSTIVHKKEMFGSVHYSSPEQTKGSFIDKRSDIYSLGVVMYEMATGKLPFEGDNPIAVALKHMKEQILNPRTLNKNMSEGLENIILKALSKNPDTRYQSVNEMIIDINRLRNNPNEIFPYSDNIDYDHPTMLLPDFEELEKMKMKNKKSTAKKKNKSGKEKSSLSLVTIILMAFIASIIIFGIIGFTILQDKFSVQEVEVPNIVNMSFEEAKVLLNQTGLYIEEDSYQYSNVIEKGWIIEQSEEPGVVLKEGFTIKVIISKGKNMIEVPNLLQKEISEAEIVLANKELVIGNIEYVINDLPAGYIISQNPKAAEEIEIGGVIDIVVSQGKAKQEYIMPTIIGLSYEEAIARFEGKNIYLNPVGYEYSTYAIDLIVSQSISQGSIIYPGTTVDVVLSNGPEPEKQVTLPLKFFTADFVNEVEKVKIEIVKDGITSVVYEAEHRKDEGEFIVELTSSGQVTINVYFGDEFYRSLPGSFVE